MLKKKTRFLERLLLKAKKAGNITIKSWRREMMKTDETFEYIELLTKFIRGEIIPKPKYTTEEKRLNRVRKAKYYRTKRNKINY